MAFVNKNILISQEYPEEAKFNLAVASHCIAVSSLFRLKDFYINYTPILTNLFGQEKIKKILNNLKSHQEESIAYYLSLYQINKNKKYLKILQAKNLTEQTPLEQLKLSLFIPELADTFKLQDKYGNSKIFQDLLKKFVG